MKAVRGLGQSTTMIPRSTVWAHFDQSAMCLVSACGWRLPILACMQPGDDVLTFAVDVEREAVKLADLELVKS